MQTSHHHFPAIPNIRRLSPTLSSRPGALPVLCSSYQASTWSPSCATSTPPWSSVLHILSQQVHIKQSDVIDDRQHCLLQTPSYFGSKKVPKTRSGEPCWKIERRKETQLSPVPSIILRPCWSNIAVSYPGKPHLHKWHNSLIICRRNSRQPEW